MNHPDPTRNTTSYGYDPNGNLKSLKDANLNTTQNAFDVLNQLQTETMPSGTLSQTRFYDHAGNLTSLKDYNGNTTTYTYDNLNRLLSKIPDPNLHETTESFTYTPTGKRQSMTDASGTTTYTYDAQDRLKTKATPQGTLSYTYDTAGNVATMASNNPHGISVAYTYDTQNRLSTVVDNNLPANQNTTSYTYDPASNLATVTYPNGLQSQFTYDTLNRITALNTTKATYTYQLDVLGNRKQVTEQLTGVTGNRIVGWTSDGIYRLTNENVSADPNSKTGTVTYTLDPAGNRQSQTSSLSGIPTASFTYDQNDRILSTASYDNNGNTTISGSRTFAYDFEDRLKTMNGTAVTLQYDADGNRVAKTVGGATTRYLVDDLNPTGYAQVVEEIGAPGVQRTYAYGLQRISQNQLANGTWTPSFYGYDGGGSVRLLTNSTGTVTDTYDYDAWGNEVNVAGSTPNVYLYRSEQYDPDLDLYYLRARYFDPVIGRFLSRDPHSGDPEHPSSLNKYVYASDDPANRIDPTGMDSSEPSGNQPATQTTGRAVSEYRQLVWFSVEVFSELRKAGTIVSIAKDIKCIWTSGGSFLKLGVWVVEDLIIPIGLARQECLVTPILSGGQAPHGSPDPDRDPTPTRSGDPRGPDGGQPPDRNCQNSTHPDLYRGGNASGPRLDNVRQKDFPEFPLNHGVVGPPGGLSSFESLKWGSGPWWKFPAGSPIPHGICLVNDSGDHWTWQPSSIMPLSEYIEFMEMTAPFWIRQ